MNKPKYELGQTVFHKGNKAWGVVEAVFESECIRANCTYTTLFYEYQYYIKHSGWTWSVPEWALAPKSNRAKNNGRSRSNISIVEV